MADRNLGAPTAGLQGTGPGPGSGTAVQRLPVSWLQSDRAKRLRRLVADTASSRLAQAVVAVLVYAGLAVQLTWPLATDLDFHIFGAFGDLTGSMATLREMVDGHHNPFAPGRLDDFGAPDGRPIEWTQNLASFPSTALLYVLGMAFGAVPAYGLFMLLGFVASGTAMFLLVRRLTGNFFISLLIGWAFAFYPFAVVKAGGHVHFTHGWPFVLIFWRMLVLYEAPSVRNGVLCGIATVIALAWSPYYLLVGGVTYAALFFAGTVVPLIRRRQARAHLKAQLVGAAIVVAFTIALVLLSIASARGTGTEENTLQALYTYSARPFEYLVPPAGNPIFGEHTGPWLEKHIHGSNFAENTLYVGVSLCLLSLVSLWSAARRRLDSRQMQAVAAAAFAGVVALLFSAPPKVAAFGELFPFPSLITFELSGAWRAYSRFVMVVMLAVAVLGAIGLHRLVRRRPLIAQALILLVVAVVVVLDLRVRPVGTNTLGIPPIYPQLKRMPPGLVAEYPIEPAGHGDYSAEFYQYIHGKPIINGYAKNSLAEYRALGLDDLENRHTAGRLRTLGVRYVVVTHVPIERDVQKPGRPGKGLRRIMPGKYASLYAVDAAPEPLATIGPGFDPPERVRAKKPARHGEAFRWLSSDDGQIELRGSCSPCVGNLVVRARSMARPRSVTLRGPSGHTFAVRKVGVNLQTVSFPVRFDKRVLLRVTTSPKREPVAGPDPRRLSVSIVQPRLRLRSRGARQRSPS
jgi:hypothetical protein